MSSDDDSQSHNSLSRKGAGDTAREGGYRRNERDSFGDGGSVLSAFHPSAFGELSLSDTSQLTDGVGTG